MDHRLVGWARAVKARNARRGIATPPLWLFSDPSRLADPLAAASRLPRGLCGVVLRNAAGAAGATRERTASARALAQVCRSRRTVLVVAGDAKLAWTIRAGLHLRGGRGVARGPGRACGFPVTASVHDRKELVAACRSGATAMFLSPVFATASHPGTRAMGVVRWSGLARRSPKNCLALGGIDGRSVRRLPYNLCHGAAGISAWL